MNNNRSIASTGSKISALTSMAFDAFTSQVLSTSLVENTTKTSHQLRKIY